MTYNDEIDFNSRPHEEVDQHLRIIDGSLPYFNSRPHEEVDGILTWTLSHVTWISTHDLTKRSTTMAGRKSMRGWFQLTTSRRGRPRSVENGRQREYFNSRPHEEVDSGWKINGGLKMAFQLTTSRRGRHSEFPQGNVNPSFQLTTSRRGRQ